MFDSPTIQTTLSRKRGIEVLQVIESALTIASHQLQTLGLSLADITPEEWQKIANATQNYNTKSVHSSVNGMRTKRIQQLIARIRENQQQSQSLQNNTIENAFTKCANCKNQFMIDPNRHQNILNNSNKQKSDYRID